MKNTDGFTLIEVIVTATIVAILAAVAIPIYTGYIASTRQDTVNNLAQTAAAAGNAYYRRTNAPLTQADLDVNKLNLFFDTTRYSIAIDPNNSNNLKVTLIGSNPEISHSTPYKTN